MNQDELLKADYDTLTEERDRLKDDVRRITEEHARIIEINKAHCRTVNSYILDNSRRDDALKAAESERDRLKQWQADQVEVIDEAKALITELNADKKALESERDRLAKRVDELQELFRIDGEDHASVVRYITNRHETRITKYAERIKELREANAELLADQRETLKAVLYHFGPEGAQKVTAHTLEQRKARALLDKHKVTSTEQEGE